MRGGDQEVAAPAGRVADLEGEQGVLGQERIGRERVGGGGGGRSGVGTYESLRCKVPIRERIILPNVVACSSKGATRDPSASPTR